MVVGASGDLARRKIFPALFALYCQDLLPHSFRIIGYARSEMTDAEFRNRITENLTCRYAPGESCADKMASFLSNCHYVSGRYDSPDSFENLHMRLREIEGDEEAHRMFYLAIPPFLFVDVARSLQSAGLVTSPRDGQWTRAVIEKPFGFDRASSDELVKDLRKVFSEDQTYRIDHYLGKEVIQNLLVLRFANLIFDPMWNRSYIDNVQITWSEDIGVEGRGQYFDSYGIIRDVIQNHLIQILALIAIEQPVHPDARDIRDEKVKVLRSIAPLTMDDLVVGQYRASTNEGRKSPGYTEDETVPNDSLTPTYAAAVLNIHNRRWDGVPFLVRAGKGLSDKKSEVRIQFRSVPGNIFRRSNDKLSSNELLIRIQPDETIAFRVNSKVPGLEMQLAQSDLDLQYQLAFEKEIPDAYECLLLDVLRGDKSLFIRADELAAAWDIFTPVLHQLEEKKIRPEGYAFGSEGPAGADELAAKYGVPPSRVG